RLASDRRRRFVARAYGSYHSIRAARDACIFARQDLTKDPPFPRLDLIICRNVLIYLAAPVQARILNTFHRALRPDGFLVVGASEGLSKADHLFAPLERSLKIYSKVTEPAALPSEVGSAQGHAARRAAPRPPI